MSLLSFFRKSKLYIFAIPVLLFGLGAFSNQVVLNVNYDRFPVMWNDYRVSQYALQLGKVAESKDPEAALKATFDLEALKEEGFLDDTHVVMTSKTHFNFLADWIDLSDATYSPGDLLLELGLWGEKAAPYIWGLALYASMRKREDERIY